MISVTDFEDEKDKKDDHELEKAEYQVNVIYQDPRNDSKIKLAGKKTKVEPVQPLTYSLDLNVNPKLQDYFRKELLTQCKFQIQYKSRSGNRLQTLPDEIETVEKLKGFCELCDLEIPPTLNLSQDPADKGNVKTVTIYKVDVNKWKTLIVACLMAITIIIANIVQLNTLLSNGPSNNKFFYPLLILVILTIVFQSLNTLMLIIVNTIKCGKRQESFEKWKDRIMNVSICVMTFITVMSIVNVFVNAFGIELD